MIFSFRQINIAIVSIATFILSNSNDMDVKQHSWKFARKYYLTEAGAFHKTGIVFICPMSISYALSTLSFGASSKKLKEIQKLLGKHEKMKAIKKENEIATLYLNDNTDDFSFGAALFLDEVIHVKPGFLSNVSEYASMFTVKNLNFRGDPAGAVKTINKFLRDSNYHSINNRIRSDYKEIHTYVNKNDITKETKAVLAIQTGIAFIWHLYFNPAEFEKTKFYSDSGEYEVIMMRATKKFEYKKDSKNNLQILKISVNSKSKELIFILPKGKNGLKELEIKLAEDEKTFVHQMEGSYFDEGFKKTKLDVSLPKFNHSVVNLDLQKTLMKMGLKSLFTKTKSDLHGISHIPFKIDKIVQKADFIGIESFMGIPEWNGQKNVPPTNKKVSNKADGIVFNADHPFLFLIRSTFPDIVLFVGKYMHPKENEAEVEIRLG